MGSDAISASHCLPVSQPAVPSPDGALVAAVHQTQLVVRATLDSQIVESFPLPRIDSVQCCHLKWFRRSEDQAPDKPLRLLFANDDLIHVFEIKHSKWKAVINGAAGGLGRIAYVDFGANEEEVLVFSDFGLKATIWSLVSSRGVELRNPKIGPKCHHYRPATKHCAILTREAAHDNLLILAPSTHQVLENVELPTVDAQGVKWSSDGRWLAIWDTSSVGYRVLIYTADGHLFKTHAGGQTADDIGLGVKNVIWSPQGRYLAIGDYNDRITILATNTFHPQFSYIHTASINPYQTGLWEEQIQSTQTRSYTRASQPSSLPSQSSLLGRSESVTGIALMEFNAEGTLLATRSDSTPSTLWIWSTTSQSPIAVLIHHAAIRSIHWHPTIADMLLIHCALDYPYIYFWRSTWEMPVIQNLHLDIIARRIEACWLNTKPGEQPAIMIGNASNYTTARVTMDGELCAPAAPQQPVDQGPDDRFDGSNIDFSPVKLPHSDQSFEAYEGPNGHTGQWNDTNELEDTFYYRHPVKLTA